MVSRRSPKPFFTVRIRAPLLIYFDIVISPFNFPVDFRTKSCYSVQDMTQTLNASDVRSNWSQLLNNVFRNKVRVIVEKSGIPVAAVISAEDLAQLTQLETQRKERFKVLNSMREAFKDVPAEEIEKEVRKAITEVRVENRSKIHR